MKAKAYSDRRKKIRNQHKARCPECGEIFDKRVLDEVRFHFLNDHQPVVATGIKGYRLGHRIKPLKAI